jgi:C1A family cysteine protease
MPEFMIAEIQREIAKQDLGWQAGSTSLAGLAPEAQNQRLGLNVAPSDQQRLRRAMEMVTCDPCDFPDVWDWRDVGGRDWTTPIRDQGACGACVAFGVLGAVEVMAKRSGGDPDRDVDYSEAHLFFCGCGRCCDTGWWPGEALDYLRDRGVPDEACFPYQARNLSCSNTCADWEERALRSGRWREVLDLGARKQWLSTIGPLVGAMAVYRDFFYYTGGVYRPTSGDLAGYHAVAVIGYDEAQGAWLCKNSWGTGWGEKGWFRMAYGVCGMDTEFPGWGVQEVFLPEEPPPERSGCNLLGRALTS